MEKLKIKTKKKPIAIKWLNAEINDDGKQSNTLTGCSHPGCCKQ